MVGGVAGATVGGTVGATVVGGTVVEDRTTVVVVTTARVVAEGVALSTG